jgi:hypothetical protein
MLDNHAMIISEHKFQVNECRTNLSCYNLSEEKYLKLKWGDFVIFFVIASVIALMLVLSVPKDDEAELSAQIIKDGELLYEVNLNDIEDRQTYLLDDGDVIIIAETGRVRFLESDCPNQICVHTGWISKANQIAACLPNRILVKIVGTNEEVDAVVG